MNNGNDAISAYENALRHNRYSVHAMLAIANILRGRDQFAPAIDYLRAITKFEERNGDVWASLGITPNSRRLPLRSLLILTCRTLLSHAGQLARRISSLPTSIIPFARSSSMSSAVHYHELTDEQMQEPRLWYGIGILYDRYGSLEHAEEAFSQVMRMSPEFEKANEIYFRLGIIYKQQTKYKASLDVSSVHIMQRIVG